MSGASRGLRFRSLLDQRASLNMSGIDAPGVRPIVFFDLAIGETSIGRLKMELFSDIVPKTCELRVASAWKKMPSLRHRFARRELPPVVHRRASQEQRPARLQERHFPPSHQ